MAKHVITVCIFCFICATHSPCASHAAVSNENPHKNESGNLSGPNSPLLFEELQLTSREKYKLKNDSNSSNNNINRLIPSNYVSSKTKTNSSISKLVKRDVNNNVPHINTRAKFQNEDYLRKIFTLYGDGNSMSMEGFERLIQRLDLLQVLSMKLDTSLSNGTGVDNDSTGPETSDHINMLRNDSCISRSEILAALKTQNQHTDNTSVAVDNDSLKRACPAILYSMMIGTCAHEEATHMLQSEPDLPENYSKALVWVYSNLAVFVVSACGVLGLAVIPVMQKRFYQPLLQFLVALAVGTLAGDALLHLLPHAMTSSHDHEHNANVHVHSHMQESSHDENMWKGFVAMMGLTFFFFMERIILFIAKWRKMKQLRKLESSRVKIIKQIGSQTDRSGEKQCINKYSSFPLCYNEILNTPSNRVKLYNDPNEMDDAATTILDELDSNSDMHSFKKSRSASDKLEAHQNNTECSSDIDDMYQKRSKMLNNSYSDNTDYTVILREHESNHHGHSHSHGHVHAAPKSMSSVAWMVIMGDGLHNFTDGMAIGAAFSGSMAGGFSTAVAVFCHELPHELGDFAMLLKAGMTMKQALFYNLLSSVLCILGNAFGVMLGNTPYASSWVFALAAGMFIYIALVDMMPELSSAHDDEGNLIQCFLHSGGLLLGFLVMALIAIYEHDLKNIFNDPI